MQSPGWQLTSCVAWCLIWWFASVPYTWHWMSLLRPDVIKQHKPKPHNAYATFSSYNESWNKYDVDKDYNYVTIVYLGKIVFVKVCGFIVQLYKDDYVPCINSYSASHDNWCTATLWNRIMTVQCEGMGEVGSARYEPALLPPCPSIRALSYSNCQRSTHSNIRAWQFKC